MEDLEHTFELPNTIQQRFPTGQRELRITSSFYNLSNPASSGTGIYQAQGLLQSSQTEDYSTRNARVITLTDVKVKEQLQEEVKDLQHHHLMRLHHQFQLTKFHQW